MLHTESIADQLYRIIRDRIVSGEFLPGTRVDPTAIAAEFNVSRTPVRDALAQLEIDRLIETKPRTGTFVVQPVLRDIHEICEVRRGIEWVAARSAIQTMPRELIEELRDEVFAAAQAAEDGDFEPFFASDARLHGTIVSSSGNSRLIQARETIEPFAKWLRVLGATGLHRVRGSTKRHLEILDAMLAGDIAATQEATIIHLDEVEEWTAADLRDSLS